MADLLRELKKEAVFEKLLDCGLFSEKLNPIFTSSSYGKWIRKEGLKMHKEREFSVVSFHLTRNNNAPRIIEIPHPISYYRLCNEIKEEWWIYVYTLYYDSPRKAVFKKIAFKNFYKETRKGKVRFINENPLQKV
ncbi:MAG: hypothetical protein OXH57_09010 [Ekhidna sp.]|nr:hypothetical protein [Ekhidna sp.]